MPFLWVKVLLTLSPKIKSNLTSYDLNGRADTCMTKPLGCTPETNTTLLVNYTPIYFFIKCQNPPKQNTGKEGTETF